MFRLEAVLFVESNPDFVCVAVAFDESRSVLVFPAAVFESSRFFFAVFGAMAQYGIPASLMDYMLTSVLSEVRDLKSKEYSDCLVNKGE